MIIMNYGPDCFDKILEPYKGKPLKKLVHISDNPQQFSLGFKGTEIYIHYGTPTLIRVDLRKNSEIYQRLITEGQTIHDEHFDDIFSYAAGENCVFKGKEFDIWEPFTEKKLKKALTEFRKQTLFERVNPTFGLQTWLNIYGKSRKNPQDKMSIHMRFDFQERPGAIYQDKSRKIHFLHGYKKLEEKEKTLF